MNSEDLSHFAGGTLTFEVRSQRMTMTALELVV